MKENIVKVKNYQFALSIIKLYLHMKNEQEYIISKQVLCSGTSIGANIEEADAGISKKDFIAKMSISSKEARETLYWLRLLKDSNLTSYPLETLIKDSTELIRILTSIVKTSQNKIIE